MLRSIITVIALFISCVSTLAQLTVGAGQSWSYEFTSLPLLSTEPSVFGSGTAGGAHFTLSGFDSSDHYTIELFQDSLADTPIFFGDSDINQSGSGGAINLWQDLQGWVRLNVLAGEVTINDVQLDVRIPIDSLTHNHYQAIMPVPEPGSLALLALAVSALTAQHAVRHRRRTASTRLSKFHLGA